jgi:hypothetical protein
VPFSLDKSGLCSDCSDCPAPKCGIPAHPDDQMEQQQVPKQSIRAVCEPHRSMTQQLAAPRPSWLRADTGPILLPRRYPASALEGQRQRHSASGPLHPLEVTLLDLQSHTVHPQGHATTTILSTIIAGGALLGTVSKGSGVPCTHVRGMARSVPPTSAIDTGHRQGSGHECRYRSGASSGSKLKFLVRPSPAQVRPLQLQQARAHTSNHAATTCAWCAFELMAGNPGCFI